MNRAVEGDDMGWRRHLASLPETEAPDQLWERLQRARMQSRPVRRVPWSAAIAACVLLASAGLMWQWSAQPVATTPVPELASTEAAVPVNADLRQLDDEIALAYARDAGEDELAALWQTRERLLQTLDGPAPALLARL